MFTHSLVIFAVLISLVSKFLTMENLQIRVGMTKSFQVLESTPSNTQKLTWLSATSKVLEVMPFNVFTFFDPFNEEWGAK